jgi:hypothetical protein
MTWRGITFLSIFRRSARSQSWLEKVEELRYGYFSDCTLLRCLAQIKKAVQRDELIKKKGAIVFGDYGKKVKEQESKLT